MIQLSGVFTYRLFATALAAGRRPSRWACPSTPRILNRLAQPLGASRKRDRSPCVRSSTSSPLSPCAPPFGAHAARTSTAVPAAFVKLKTRRTIITRAIVAGPRDTFSYSGYAESVSVSSLYECFTGFVHVGSSGAVSLSHIVCCAVVVVVHLLTGRGSKIVWSDCTIQGKATSRWSLYMENSWTTQIS